MQNDLDHQGPPDFDFGAAVKQVKEGNPLQHVTDRLLAELSIKEKLSVLTGPLGFWPGLRQLFSGGLNKEPYKLGAVDRLKIPGIRFCDGPRGVVLGEATCFPIAMARGATWDTALERRVGAAIAKECRAKGANTSGSVCINLPRHPAWGRIQESYGEDPMILGEFGVALSEALQENGVMACVKHFALNSMENARFRVNVSVDDAALHEVYLAHFEMVVRAGVMSVMSAYNAYNGEWCGQNDVLLNQILRQEWGFSGFVISDWVFGLRDSVKSIKNGLDLEAPFAQVRSKLQKELNDGKFTVADVDRSVGRLLSMQLQLYSKRTSPDPTSDVILCDDHHHLSREVAARSMVLLKNDAKLLPIDASRVKSCAMIGVLANSINTGDWGSSYVNSPHVVKPHEGIRSALPAAKVTLTASYSVDEAKEAARSADYAIVVVGYGAKDEGENLSANNPMSLIPFPSLSELFQDVPPILFQQVKERLGFTRASGPSMGGKAGGDRKSLRLSKKNIELIRAVRNVNQNTIVAIVASGAIVMEEWIDNVDTVLMNWYSGCEGGHALADVLFGQVDASGRLPFSIPRDEKHLPYFDASATQITYDKWFGQRLLDKKGFSARFPLGFGLSYTTFAIDDLHVEQQQSELLFKVKITNTGTRPGRHVLQAYGLPQRVESDFPSRVLLGFSSVSLDAGLSQDISFTGRIRPLQKWNGHKFEFASNDIVVEIGSFAGDRSAVKQIRLEEVSI